MCLRLTTNETMSKKQEALQKVHSVIFLTSGKALIFDKEGEQIGELQKSFTSGEPNRTLLKEIADVASVFTIAKWREWSQDLNREEFIKLLNLD